MNDRIRMWVDGEIIRDKRIRRAIASMPPASERSAHQELTVTMLASTDLLLTNLEEEARGEPLSSPWDEHLDQHRGQD